MRQGEDGDVVGTEDLLGGRLDGALGQRRQARDEVPESLPGVGRARERTDGEVLAVPWVIEQEAQSLSASVSTGTCHCDRDHCASMHRPTRDRKLYTPACFIHPALPGWP